MQNIYISLGSNLGKRNEHLKSALKEIREFARITKKSKVYETDPIGLTEQGKFLNMVIEIETELKPIELIVRLEETEHKLGRVREMVNGPRTIDLDILIYGSQIVNTPNLKIPHPRMHKREFVLIPFAEISEETIHPKLKKSIKELKNELRKN
ncbi:MAG: 2-amino-4-hydroxy-6-hydroxymethyldihydropteridine diphosphokinase [bacterium]|nr:2-amino-4-hydroxy-6-hydroxymethyldihydropteridine diphosphokinase [bacterium]